MTYTKDQLLDILNEPVQGNGLIALCHQLIAAKLNIANGAPHNCIDPAVMVADLEIGDLVCPPIGDGFIPPCNVQDLVDKLDLYNNGHAGCAPHCDDEEQPPLPIYPDGCLRK